MAESPPETGDAAAASPNRLACPYKEPDVPGVMGLGTITHLLDLDSHHSSFEEQGLRGLLGEEKM
jgi:hypothetical protein